MRKEPGARRNGKLNLVFRLRLRDVCLGVYLTAGVWILAVAMPLLTTIAGLLIGKEQAYAVLTLKQENGRSEKHRNESLANHALNLPTCQAQCQTQAPT